jgi:thermitase
MAMENAMRIDARPLHFALLLLLIVATALPAEARRPKRVGPAFVDGQVLVGFQPGTPASARSDAHREAGGRVEKSLEQIGVDQVAVAAGTVAQSIAAYQRNPNVRFAEPNYVRVMILPNEGEDPPPPFGTGIDYVREQWGLNNTGQSIYYDPWTGAIGAIAAAADADIDAPEGWELSTGNAGVRIAILDAGIDCLHVDLKTKCVEQRLVTSQSTTLEDVIGHGTHVAAIAAAETNNNKGTAGVGWSSTFGSLKVCYEYYDPFFGLVGLCDTAASASAMIYAADNGYKVVNMSYAGPEASQTEGNAARYAWDHGVVLVAAAANDYARTPMYPAAYPEVVAVAATDWHDNLAGFSNFGSSWVSVAAPGHYIFSALPNAACGIAADDPDGCYGWLSGTSMASPHVAGAAALVWAKLGTTATPQQVRAAIEGGADKIGTLGQNFLAWTQHGRLNVHGALTGTTPPPTVSVHVGDMDASASATQGGRWTAIVTIVVHDAAETPVSGISVAGSWSGGASGGSSCVTVSGVCQVSKQVQKNSASATFSVTSLSGASYAAALNHDPDGDSSGTAVTVSRP